MFRFFVHHHRFTTRTLAACILGAALCQAPGQPAIPRQQDVLIHAEGATAANWVKAAADNETHIIDDNASFPVSYRAHHLDSKGNITRQVIECTEGTVARLVERDGQPITREQDQAERARLQDILNNPGDFLKHQKRNLSARTYATQLVKLIPTAMLYTYAPGQPQPSNSTSSQIVIDFKPNPSFNPPNTISELLTGLEGRMWIDKRSQRLTRVEGRVIKPVNFGWGVLAHIYPGGTVEFEQTEAAPGHWIYSHVDENITIREMMLHTAEQKARMTATDIHALPAPVSCRDAVHQLLDLQIPLQ